MRSQLVNSDGDKRPFLFLSIFFSLGTFWKCLWTTQGTFRHIPFLLATLLEMELEECGQLGDYSLLTRGSAELEVKPFPCLRACFCCSHSVGCVTPKSTGVSHHTWFCWSILLSPMVSPPASIEQSVPFAMNNLSPCSNFFPSILRQKNLQFTPVNLTYAPRFQLKRSFLWENLSFLWDSPVVAGILKAVCPHCSVSWLYRAERMVIHLHSLHKNQCPVIKGI